MDQLRIGEFTSSRHRHAHLREELLEVWLSATTPQAAHAAIDIVEEISAQLARQLEQGAVKFAKEVLEEERARVDAAAQKSGELRSFLEECEKTHYFHHFFRRGRAGQEQGPGISPFLAALSEARGRWEEHQTKAAGVNARLDYVREHLAKEPQVLQVPGETLSPERRAAIEAEVKFAADQMNSVRKLVEAGRASQAEYRQAQVAFIQAQADLEPRTVTTINPAWSTLKQKLVELEIEHIGLEAAKKVLTMKWEERQATLTLAQEYLDAKQDLADAQQNRGWAEGWVEQFERYLAQPEVGLPAHKMGYVVQAAPPADLITDKHQVLPELLKPLRKPGE